MVRSTTLYKKNNEFERLITNQYIYQDHLGLIMADKTRLERAIEATDNATLDELIFMLALWGKLGVEM